MQRFRLFGVLAMAMLIATACDVWAQPRGDGGGQGRRGGVQVQRFLPVEQVLSYLAFNDNIALTDEQLTKVRATLKGIYTKRQELQRSMRENNDQQAAMQSVRELRMEMTQGLREILTADQDKLFQEQMQRMSQRGQRGQGGQGRGGQGRGGQGGGRGGGQGGQGGGA